MLIFHTDTQGSVVNQNIIFSMNKARQYKFRILIGISDGYKIFMSAGTDMQADFGLAFLFSVKWQELQVLLKNAGEYFYINGFTGLAGDVSWQVRGGGIL